MLKKLAPYNKTIVAVVGAFITWVGLVVMSPEAAISSVEWFVLLSTTGTALGVYQISNKEI